MRGQCFQPVQNSRFGFQVPLNQIATNDRGGAAFSSPAVNVDHAAGSVGRMDGR